MLSVDTFHAEVACQAVHAGADIVNDVSGGALDPSMRQQVGHVHQAQDCKESRLLRGKEQHADAGG